MVLLPLMRCIYFWIGTINILGVGTDASVVDQSKRLRTGGDYTHSPYAPPPYHPPPPTVSMWGTAG